MGMLFGSSSSSANTTNTDSSQHDLRTVGGSNAFVVGQGATFNGIDPKTLATLTSYNSDGLKYMTQLGTETISKLGDSVTNVLDKSAANMETAWSHQVDVMGNQLAALSAASKANADAGQVVATAALGANANAGQTLSDVAKWAALAVLGYVLARSIFKKG